MIRIKGVLILLAALACCPTAFARNGDEAQTGGGNLSKEFHAGRREALRSLMPANSVAAIFAYPERNFSNDVDYVYHPNPDLYYFSGYTEPDAVLFIFKETQQTEKGSFNELIFIRKKDAQREQWTGRRLGIEGTKTKLGFAQVYNGEDFRSFPLDFKKFSSVLFPMLPEDYTPSADPGNLAGLLGAFKEKISFAKETNTLVLQDMLMLANATPRTLPRFISRLQPKLSLEAYKNNQLLQQLAANPDSATLELVKAEVNAKYAGISTYNKLVGSLREIKTPEELVLLRKSCEISAIAHKEAMRAVQPGMSERELQGLLEYVHRKYDAEGEGYPPIVGAGGNGCILHYIENSLPQVNNQLVLMDVGSEYRGYSADVTRTIPANGKFSPEQKAIYQLVYDAQEEVFKLCKEGTPWSALNEKAKEVLAAGLIKLGIIKEASEVSRYYPHGCSHHLGLDVHDKNRGGPLKENMVITVEPGIYIPAGSPCDKKWWDIAVRIEDDIVIGKEKGENISAAAPRSWQDVEKAIAEKSVFENMKLPALKN